MSYEGMRRLLAAIILTAVIDYQHAYHFVESHSCKDPEEIVEMHESKKRIKEIEYFFRGAWFESINPFPKMTGEAILRKIQDGVSEKVIATSWRTLLNGER